MDTRAGPISLSMASSAQEQWGSLMLLRAAVCPGTSILHEPGEPAWSLRALGTLMLSGSYHSTLLLSPPVQVTSLSDSALELSCNGITHFLRGLWRSVSPSDVLDVLFPIIPAEAVHSLSCCYCKHQKTVQSFICPLLAYPSHEEGLRLHFPARNQGQ